MMTSSMPSIVTFTQLTLMALTSLDLLGHVVSQGGQEGIKNCLPPSIDEVSEKSTIRKFFIVNHNKPANYSIPCTSNGDNPRVYRWLKDGKLMNLNDALYKNRLFLDSGVGNLQINSPTNEDSGHYQCQVSNNCGTALSAMFDLQQAQSDAFVRQETPIKKTVMLGDSTVLKCTPPASVPKARSFWSASSDEEGDDDSYDFPKAVATDNRVTLDYDGNLYINNAMKEDELDGKIYKCISSNKFTNTMNQGMDTKLKIIGKTPIKKGVQLKWFSKDELFLENKRAKLKCIFTGNPLPTIEWQRVGADIDPSSVKGDELIIEKISDTDIGDYKCIGTDERGQTAEHTFSVKVEAKPVWDRKPKDMTVGVEEDAELSCEPKGNPKPVVKFYINGKPIEDAPENPRRQQRGNTLFFKALEQGDSQVIQCNASNTHGFVFADVYLYVQALAASINRGPDNKLVIAETTVMRIPCEVVGKPTPSVVWYKGAQQLLEGRYEINSKGTLIVKKAALKDSGSYKCRASNRFGEDEAEGEVMVRRKTKIVTGPLGQTVEENNDVTFRCEATTDEAEIDKLSYSWLKDGTALSSSKRIIISSGQVAQLVIKRARSSDTGNYTCEASNSLDKASKHAVLQVSAVPDPPFDVLLEKCNIGDAIISFKFKEKMRNFKKMKEFIVESMYQVPNHKKTVEHWTQVSKVAWPSDDYKATIDLSPYAIYRFRVRAVNEMGASQPSAATLTPCETIRSIPSKNPEGVRTDGRYSGYLTVQWKPMPPIDHNGDNFFYEVEHEEVSSGILNKTIVSNYTLGEVRIPVDNYYRPYNIKVRAKNELGFPQVEPNNFLGYSGEAPPVAVVQNFDLDPEYEVTATKAKFVWDKIDTSVDSIRGKWRGFRIRFWKAGEPHDFVHEVAIPRSVPSPLMVPRPNKRQAGSNQDSAIVDDLPSFSDLQADIVVINMHFEGNGSEVVNFTTPEGVPGRVRYLEPVLRGSHHFLLEWEAPTEPNGIITGYDIYYQLETDRNLGPRQKTSDTPLPESDRRRDLTGLKPASKYMVCILASTQVGPGEELCEEIETHGEAKALTPPMILDVIDLSQTEVNVTWDKNRDKNNRYGLMHFIEHKQKDDKIWHQTKVTWDQGYQKLRELRPGTDYLARMKSLSHQGGTEGFSSEKPFTTIWTGDLPFRVMTLNRVVRDTDPRNSSKPIIPTLSGASRASFLTAGWFIGMMVAIAVLFLILIVVCIIKRNRGDNYSVSEKERLRGGFNDDNNGFTGIGKPETNGVGDNCEGGGIPLPLDDESLGLEDEEEEDDKWSNFNEDGSFIGCYGQGDKTDTASSIV